MWCPSSQKALRELVVRQENCLFFFLFVLRIKNLHKIIQKSYIFYNYIRMLFWPRCSWRESNWKVPFKKQFSSTEVQIFFWAVDKSNVILRILMNQLIMHTEMIIKDIYGFTVMKFWQHYFTNYLIETDFEKDKNLLVISHQNHACWCPGDLCHQGISRHVIDLES